MRPLCRRELLVRAGVLVGSGLAAVGAPLGCGPSPADRLSLMLRELYGDPAAAHPVARASGRTREWAAGVLRSGLADREGERRAGDPVALREHVERRRLDDLAAGRVVRVGGLWLAETEIAVAVLMAPGS